MALSSEPTCVHRFHAHLLNPTQKTHSSPQATDIFDPKVRFFFFEIRDFWFQKSEERLKLFGSKMRLENLGFRNQMKD